MRGVRIKPFNMEDQRFRVEKLPDDVLVKKMKLKFIA